MKIAFDVRILFEKEKTGIGRMTDYLIQNMVREYSDQFFFYYFRTRKGREIYLKKKLKISKSLVPAVQLVLRFSLSMGNKDVSSALSLVFWGRCTDYTVF